jgi:uncharacterized protein (DUF2237 family)
MKYDGRDLTVAFCEDWFIYAIDECYNTWALCTELWPEWLAVPEARQYDLDAVERYMIPVVEECGLRHFDWIFVD